MIPTPSAFWSISVEEMLQKLDTTHILILFFATGLFFYLGDPADALIILGIVLTSGHLGFWQERGATTAVEKLLAIVQIKADVLRDARSQEIPVEEIVPGDEVF